LNRVLVELASSSSKSNAVKSQLNDSLERLRSVTAEKSTVTLERDELAARYRELERGHQRPSKKQLYEQTKNLPTKRT
jgi:hypothetical protein